MSTIKATRFHDIAKDFGIQRICVVLIKEKLTYKEIHNERI